MAPAEGWNFGWWEGHMAPISTGVSFNGLPMMTLCWVVPLQCHIPKITSNSSWLCSPKYFGPPNKNIAQKIAIPKTLQFPTKITRRQLKPTQPPNYIICWKTDLLHPSSISSKKNGEVWNPPEKNPPQLLPAPTLLLSQKFRLRGTEFTTTEIAISHRHSWSFERMQQEGCCLPSMQPPNGCVDGSQPVT